jgi:hypothetical protein
MDEFTRDLELMEVISASDALNNARTVLEEAETPLDEEQREAMRRHVFPALEREHERLAGEYMRLRG